MRWRHSAVSVQVTQLLIDWGNGDKEALEQLIPMVYDELHRIARNYMWRERTGHTLQASALVNEALIRLIEHPVLCENRAHFYGIAARLMRQVLVDHARSQQAQKREMLREKVPLDVTAKVASGPSADIVALDDALQSLAKIDPRQCQIVELKYFGGFTIPEIAEAIGVAHATIEREWNVARAWLRRDIQGAQLNKV